VKLRSLAVFGVGYVLGTRAGRERYGQIVAAAQGASKRLEDYSGKLDKASSKIDEFSGRLNGFRARLQDYGSQQ
jgi:chromosome segregation ATPase